MFLRRQIQPTRRALNSQRVIPSEQPMPPGTFRRRISFQGSLGSFGDFRRRRCRAGVATQHILDRGELPMALLLVGRLLLGSLLLLWLMPQTRIRWFGIHKLSYSVF